MKTIFFGDIKKGDWIVFRDKERKLYRAKVVSTTEGHLGLREVRVKTGEVFSYDFTDMFPYNEETRTECLLAGEEIHKRERKK